MNKIIYVSMIPLEFQFISDSQEVEPIKDYVGGKAEEFDSFFVLIENGDYKEIWGMYGIVPMLYKPLVLVHGES